ncbi:MAG: hypothetical protein HRT71_14100 [Flavobacteriales bacterium]|nr:hypothetical protein [Flavobacteriales bacterium]
MNTLANHTDYTENAENEYMEMWIDDGIMFYNIKQGLKSMNLEMAKQNVAFRLKFSKGRTMPLVANLGSIIQVDKATRAYLAQIDAITGISCTAIAINSLSTKLIASMYITYDKPPVPTKFFTDMEKAKEWCNGFKNLN